MLLGALARLLCLAGLSRCPPIQHLHPYMLMKENFLPQQQYFFCIGRYDYVISITD